MTKPAKADQASAQPGHNNELTPAENRALHFHHFRAIEDQKAKVKTEQAELKRLRKTAKTDGCVMADLDYMARCADLEDPSIAPEEIRRRAEIASWFALPVNFQPDMFTDRMPLDDRAYEEGVAAGLLGKNCEAPYDETSTAGQRWIEGWHEGQRQMREDLQAAMEKKNASMAASGDELIEGERESENDDDPFEQREAAE